jgi:hypothetical protein
MSGRLCLVAGSLVFLLGCGDSSDGKGSGREDTQIGAGAPVPAEKTCNDLCLRLGDCVEKLCNEDASTDDMMSTRYTGLRDLLAGTCNARCNNDLVKQQFSDDKWSCLFMSSCRMVLDYDSCLADGSYDCK